MVVTTLSLRFGEHVKAEPAEPLGDVRRQEGLLGVLCLTPRFARARRLRGGPFPGGGHVPDWHSMWLGRRTLARDPSAFEIEAFFSASRTPNGVLSKIAGVLRRFVAHSSCRGPGSTRSQQNHGLSVPNQIQNPPRKPPVTRNRSIRRINML
jgi:hypothetical protein